MTLLSICQSAAQDAPTAVPETIIGNTDADAKLLLACATRSGQALLRYKSGGWVELGREYDFTTVALSLTGTVTAGSATITDITPNTDGVSQNIFQALGTGLPGNAIVQSVDSSSQITLNQAASSDAAGAGTSLTLSQFGYALPSDFQRPITDTEWDRTRRWPMIGPRSPQQWQLYKSGLIGTASFQRRWRIKAITVNEALANYFCIDPTPPDNGSELVFEYISNAWCQSASGAPQTGWQSDTDTGIVDEYLLSLGTVWRFLKRRGFTYQEELDEYERETAKAFANNGGMPILALAPEYASNLLGPWNIPDTGFGNVNG